MREYIVKKSLSVIATVILIAVIAVPVLASPATATRTLPASVESGATCDVTIQPSGCGFAGQVVETLPPGFTYISCTPSDIGVGLGAGNTVKFTFLDSDSFTYTVRSPVIAATNIYTFRGVVKDENKNEYPIEDNDIAVIVSTSTSEDYTLTMVVDGNGSTTPSVGRHTCDARDVVNISATADSGWRFDYWSSNVADPSSSSTTVTMDGGRTVTAYFTRISSAIYSLTVTCEPDEGGSVTLNPAAEGNQYEEGALLELTAIPNDGYAFGGWSGDFIESDNPITVTMDSNKNVIASFLLSVSRRPASFAVSSLEISPEQVQPNQRVDISIKIANHGEEAGGYEAALYIDGQLENSHIVEISPGSSRNVVFSVTKATPRTYTVSLGGLEGQFTVVGSQSAGGGLDTGSRIAIVVIVALIAALALLLRRMKKGT